MLVQVDALPHRAVIGCVVCLPSMVGSISAKKQVLRRAWTLGHLLRDTRREQRLVRYNARPPLERRKRRSEAEVPGPQNSSQHVFTRPKRDKWAFSECFIKWRYNVVGESTSAGPAKMFP